MKKRKEDIIIMTWKYCKNKQFYELTEVKEYLISQGFDYDSVNFATSLANESSYKLKNGKLSIKAESYVNLLNYEEVQVSKKSFNTSIVSMWIAIAALVITTLLGIFNFKPIQTIDISNKGIEKQQQK